MIQIVIVEKPIPILNAHIHRVVAREFLHVEMLLDKLPLRLSGGARQILVQIDQILMTAGCPRSLCMLPNQAVFKPEDLVEISRIISLVSAQE